MDSQAESSTQDLTSNNPSGIIEQTSNELEVPQEEPKGHFFSDTDDEIDENDLPSEIKYEKILAEHTEENGSISYLVKLPNLSYHHLEWIPEQSILNSPNSETIISEFKTLTQQNQSKDIFNPDNYQIEKLITFRIEPNGTKSYLTKWTNLDYRNLTWEPESGIPQKFIIEFTKYNQIPDFKDQFITPKMDYTKWRPFEVPEFTPKDYQIEDLNFIAHSFCHEQNVILSYENGLGSSVECCMFLKWLIDNENIKQPFLIIATEKRIEEFKNSLKLLNIDNFQVLTFTKPRIQRDVIAGFELFYPGTKLGKSNIVFSNYSIQAHKKILSEIRWHTIFIDVTHIDQIDIEKCLTDDFFNLLSKFESNFTVLICNHFEDIYLKNYFSILFKTLSKLILNFIGKVEPNLQAFLFRAALNSILLKRTHSSISTSVRKYSEYLIDCSLSDIQYDFYISLYQKYLNYFISNSNGFLIEKVFTELKNLCTHPYLNKGKESDILLYRKEMGIGKASNFFSQSLIDVSSKMTIFDLIVTENLPKKKRLMILSHQDEVLDIVQDYFINKDISFKRLGIDTRSQIKSNILKNFNMIGSLDFAILICLNDHYTDSIEINRVDTVVIMETNWNPTKDVSNAISMCTSETVTIYRLLAFGTIERAMYDLALLKLGSESNEQLTPNQEMLTLIGFGLDPPHPIDYTNNNLAKILNRSIKNYYDSLNLIDHSSTDCPVPDVKEDPFSKFATVLSIEHFTQENSGERSTMGFWTMDKLLAVEDSLIHFGWGRWHSMVKWNQELLSGVAEFEVEGLCYMFMDILLKCKEKKGKQQHQFSIANNIIQNWTLSEQASQFLNQFRQENQNLEINPLIQNSTQKLSSIEFMYVINVIVTTCPKPPDQIVVPYIEPTIDEPWDENADRYLLFHIFKKGYMRFGESKVPHQLLEFRAKMLIDTLKERYTAFCEFKNGSAKFEHFTLLKAVNMMTLDEQQKYVQTLIYFGWTTPEEFKKISGSYRTETELKIIHKIIIDFCKGHNEMINDLAESIPKHISKLILSNEQLLYNVRNNLTKEQVSTFDWPIVEYVKNNGLVCLENCDEIRNRFGIDFLEYKVSSFLRKFFQKLHQVASSSINLGSSRIQAESNAPTDNSKSHTPHPRQSPQINVDYDANGNPVMPIQIVPSLIILNLGEIVTDRPNFYNSRYIYPRGFESMKQYRSTDNPNDKAWYQSMILDDGTDSPLFRVQLKDNPDVYFDGRAPSKPWLDVFRAVNDKKKEFGLPISKNVTVSGPEYYGLAVPLVQALIQKMKGADICINYGKVEVTTMKPSPQPSLESIPKPPGIDDISTQNASASTQQTEDEEVDDSYTHKLRHRKQVVSYADSTDDDEADEIDDKENDGEFINNQKEEDANDDLFPVEKDEESEKEENNDTLATLPKKNSQSSNPKHSTTTNNQQLNNKTILSSSDSNPDNNKECIIQ